MTLDNILLCATTYEPSAPQARDLVTMLTDAGAQVLIYDNSMTPAARDVVREACESHEAHLVVPGRNAGTAGALNHCLRFASMNGFDWILYFDQDSRISEGFWARIASLAEHDSAAAIGSTIFHRDTLFRAVDQQHPALSPAEFLIASGTMYKVAALLSVDGFDESFGLDLVDHEVCLRLRSRRLPVMLDSQRSIMHEIGEGSRPSMLGRIRVTRHPLWRRRMMWRNSLFLVRRYGTQAPVTSVRHLAGRVVETAAATWSFRDVSYLTAAVQGIGDAWRDDPVRQGAASGSAGGLTRPL